MTSGNTNPVSTSIIYDIYDPENDEKLVVREVEDIPGLIVLQWDFNRETGEPGQELYLTPEQADHVSSAMTALSVLIKTAERKAATKGGKFDH